MAAGKEFEALVTLAGSIDPSLSDALNQAKKGLESLDKSTSSSSSALKKTSKTSNIARAAFNTLTTAAGNLVSSGISKVTSAISSSMDSAIDRVDTLNSYSKTMENLGYSVEEVADASKKLQDGIDGLPTTLPAITTMQQQYAALTGDIGLAADLTVALNDATLAGGQGQEVATRAAEQWYKVIAKGKPDLQSWTTINSAMPAQMNQIAQSLLGAEAKSQDLFEAWKSGKVTTEQVQQAVIELDKKGGEGFASFADQAQDATGGIATSMSNLKTAVVTGVANILQNIGPSGLSGALNKAKSSIKAGFAEIADAVNIFKDGDFVGGAEKLEGIFSSMLDAIDINLPEIAKKAGEIIPYIVSGLAANIPDMLDMGLQFIFAFVEGFGEGIPYLVAGIPALVAGIIEAVISNLPALLEAGGKLLEGIAQGLIEALPVLTAQLPKLIETIVTAISQSSANLLEAGISILLAIIDGLIEALPIIAEHVPQIITAVVTALGNNMPLLIQSGIRIINELVNGLVAALPQLIGTMPMVIQTVANGILSNLPQILSSGMRIIASLVQGIVGNLPLVISGMARVGASILSAMAKIPGQMISVGLNILKGLWQGISSGLSWLSGKISGLAAKITATFKEKLGVHSPSRVLADEVGKFIPPGIAVGVEYSMPAALKDMSNTIGNAVAKLSADVDVNSTFARPNYTSSSSKPERKPVRSTIVGGMLSRSNPVRLASSSHSSRVNMGGITFSPTIKVESKNGEKMKPETILKALRDYEPEFVDFVMQALAAREEGAYVTDGAGLY